MTINYSKIIFLNLIASILVYILFNDDTMTSIEGIIFLGFISSFFFRENLLGRFLKLMLINMLAFGLLTVIIAYLGWIVIYIMGESNLDSLFVFLSFISLAFGNMILYSYGYIAGIIPQGIRERFRKQEKGNLLDRS
jgi:hypothetical protein